MRVRSMLRASGVAADIDSSAVPLLPGARELADAGHIPGGSKRNLEDLSPDVAFAGSVDTVARLLLADAQTSGGLLLAVPAELAAGVVSELKEKTPAAAMIGRIVDGAHGRISVS